MIIIEANAGVFKAQGNKEAAKILNKIQNKDE